MKDDLWAAIELESVRQVALEWQRERDEACVKLALAQDELDRLERELAEARSLTERVAEFGLSNELEALGKVDARDATIARLREALQFYGAARVDGGRLAREALMQGRF